MTALWILLTLAAPANTRGLEGEVRTAIAEAARERLGLSADAEIEITSLRLSEPGLLRGQRSLVSVELPPGEAANGRVMARVTVRDSNKAAAEHDTWATAKVQARVPSVVSTRRIERGDLVSAADVTMKLVPFGEAGLASGGLAVGRVARRTLRDGEVLRADALELPTLIQRGDHVQVVIASASFNLRAPAEALNRGALGDSISLRVARTGKVLTGIITGPATVEVSP